MNVGKISIGFAFLALTGACQTTRKMATVVLPTPQTDTMTVTPVSSGRTDAFLENLLKSHPESFQHVIEQKDQNRVQIIYTKIDRHKNGRVQLTDYYYNVNPDLYFYPASTVKFPAAVLALQKLNQLNQPGLDKNTTMITEPLSEKLTGVFNDPLTADGRPTIAQYIKKIFLVSDNDAFNRLYEFLGQEYFNSSLHNMGLVKTEIRHRLSIALSEQENRMTNPVRFFSPTGDSLFDQAAATSRWTFQSRTTTLGKGYLRGDQLVNDPFSFSTKNRLPLEDLHGLLKRLYFPENFPAAQRFNLKPEDYDFLKRYMSMTPEESDYPFYDTAAYWPAYVKFLFYGSEKGAPQPGLRIFNKVGDAYGFLTDVAYVVDFENQVEFMLSATIHCNSDGIFNDDKYEYDTIGLPFLKALGRVIYEYERSRERKVKPDLSTLQFSYKQ